MTDNTDKAAAVDYDRRELSDLFTELEEVTARMEEEDVSLEESFALYKKGMEMLKACGRKIDKVEKEMVLLTQEGNSDE